MQKTTILIIDDFELVRDAWTSLLQTEGKFDIVGKIGDGREVEDCVRNTKPQVVLLDINMRPLDGFEVLQIIKKESPGTKVIAVSMHSQTVYAKRMLREGASGYVTKNSPSREFIHAIEVVMKGGKYVCKEVKDALAELVMKDEASPVEKLSPREVEIMRYMSKGLSSKQIAEKLSVTVKTVEVHRHNILKKLDVNNSIAAVNVAKEHGL